MFGKKLSLQMWLLVLSLISAVPPLIYGAFLISEIRQTQLRDQLESLIKKADSTANTVQQLLLRDLGVLQSLSTSAAAHDGDIHALYDHAQRVLKLNPDINAISLVGPDLMVKFLTTRPYGSPEFATGEINTAQQVFQNGAIQVSEPFKVEGVPAAITSLSIPVFRDGKVIYCLRAILRVRNLTDILAGQNIPPTWVAAIIHKNGQLVAKLNGPEELSGRMSPPAMINAIKAGTVGWFKAAIQRWHFQSRHCRQDSSVGLVCCPWCSRDSVTGVSESGTVFPLHSVIFGDHHQRFRLLAGGPLRVVQHE